MGPGTARTSLQAPVAPRSAAHLLGTSDEVLSALKTSWDGLTDDAVAARLRQRGAPSTPSRTRGVARAFVAQFTHFFALTLWGAAGLALIGRLPELATAIAVVVIVNGLFSFAQELRADHATRALAALMPAQALVRRNGERQHVDASAVVAGDVLILEEGARVCADARVLRAVGLRVDNSALTGESEPVPRTSEPLPQLPADDLEAKNLVFSGSWVISGSGLAVVVATGDTSRLGGIAQLTRHVVRRATPLHAALDRTVRSIAVIAVGAGALFVAVSMLVGMPLQDGLLFSVGVIVALVPEGLLPTLTLALAMGATRMTRRGALVRHLEAVETLGCTTTICTDKTGTLTMNQMTVTRAWTWTRPLHASGAGYRPRGALMVDDRPLSAAERGELEDLLRASALCGDARVERRETGRWVCEGDPTEAALIVFAQKGGLTREAAERATPRVGVFPFESARRRMSTIHRLPSGAHLVLTKGSVEAVVPRCSAIRIGVETSPLTDNHRARIAGEAEHFATSGLRVLALAQKVTDDSLHRPEAAEHTLEFLGLVAMSDPVRPEVPESIARCQRAGIRVLMVTGDHPATAGAIARTIGLCGETRVGAELPADASELGQLLCGDVSVLARIAPEQKLAIARALQERGEVVAMTGDGVNDAPALRQADIGIAMGKCGTDVAREAADVVLLDDDFSHILAAVEEGRAAFVNIRRFLTYHLTDNVAELAPFLLWALSGGQIPLLLSVLQVLALDIGTDLLPALALGAEPSDQKGMQHPPRPASEPLLSRQVLARSLGYLGPLEAVLSLGLVPLGAWLFLDIDLGHALPHERSALALLSTIAFASIVLMQAANACLARTTDQPLWRNPPWKSRMLLGALLFELGALLLFVYLPRAQQLLGHQSLSALSWLLVLCAPAAFIMVEEGRKSLTSHWHQRTRAHSPHVTLRA